MTRKIRIFLADDHAMLRESLSNLLGGAEGIEVVGQAGDGRTAFAAIQRLNPDVAVVDVGMPLLNGIDLVRLVRDQAPATQVIVLSMHATDSYVIEAVRQGAKGYILKTAASQMLVAAIYAVAKGESFFCPQASEVLARQLRSGSVGRGASVLSGREREVLQLVGEGLGVAEIARRLSISPKTVRNHRDHITAKLGCRTTADLVKHAIQMGLTVSVS